MAKKLINLINKLIEKLAFSEIESGANVYLIKIENC